MVLLLATANLLFRPPLVMANGGVGSYVWQPSEDMVDMLSAPFTPYSGWVYNASFAAPTSVESFAGENCVLFRRKQIGEWGSNVGRAELDVGWASSLVFMLIRTT
jgi:hypothetical protein